MRAAPHPLTLEQLEESHLLIIGQSRTGKTYQLRGAIEQLRRADRRVGAIDKIGNHWGLTVSADGKGPGLEFVIFGGKRAMVPMTPDQGDMLGRLFVERNIPAIFDVSQWTSIERLRWVADFADAVFRYNEGALHLGVDEAQSWMPLNGGGPAFQNMLRLVEQGLGNGIRLMMSVQRLARLDATARGMSPLVVAMRQTGTIDRKAVAELMAIDAADAARLKRELPTLPAGTGYIWDPGSGVLDKHAFPPNITFDSSRTPRHGDTPPAPIAVSSTLVDELRAALAAPAPDPESQKAGKPESQNSGSGYASDAMIARLGTENAELRAELEDLRGIDQAFDRQVTGLIAIEQLVDAVASGKPWRLQVPDQPEMHSRGADPYRRDVDWPEAAPDPVAEGASREAAPVTPPPADAPERLAANVAEGLGPIGGGNGAPPLRGKAPDARESFPGALPPRQQKIVDWAYWGQIMFGGPVRRDVLAMLVGSHVRTKGFTNDVSALRSAGVIEYADGGGISLTAVGIELLSRDVDVPKTHAQLRAQISAILTPAQRRLFDLVVANWPIATPREDLAAHVKQHVRTKGFTNNLSRLRSLGLIVNAAAGGVLPAGFLVGTTH